MKNVVCSSTILMSLLISGCIYDNDDIQSSDNTKVSCEEGLYQSTFESFIPSGSAQEPIELAGGTFSYADCSLAFVEFEADENLNFERLAFTYTGEFENVLPSEIFPAQDILDFVNASSVCDFYVDAGNIDSCEDITTENIDSIIGPVANVRNINWYGQIDGSPELSPRLNFLERIVPINDISPIFLGFTALSDDAVTLFNEIDQNALTPDLPNLGLFEALIGGGVLFDVTSNFEDEGLVTVSEISEIAGVYQESPFVFSDQLIIDPDGSFFLTNQQINNAGCAYTGQFSVAEPEFSYELTVDISCSESLSDFDGVYSGYAVSLPGSPPDTEGPLEKILIVNISRQDGKYQLAHIWKELVDPR